MSLLFYCTVHSIMWTIRNSKALGKKTTPLCRLFNSFFWRFGWNCVCYIFPTLHLRCLMKSLTHSKDLYSPKYCRVEFLMKLTWKVGKTFRAGLFFTAVQCLRCPHIHIYIPTHTYKAMMNYWFTTSIEYCILLFIFEAKGAFIPPWHHWGPLYCSIVAIMLMHLMDITQRKLP